MGFIGDLLGGKQKSSTTVRLTPAQEQLTQQQVELGEFQRAELERQRIQQQTLFDPATTQASAIEQSFAPGGQFADITQTPPTQLAPSQIQAGGAIPGVTPSPNTSIGEATLLDPATIPERNLASGETSDELLAIQLERIRAGGQATQQEIDLINTITERALASGETDISRFTQAGLEQLREELAPQLGLRPSDTPLLDRGGRVVAEGGRQQGQLVSALRGQQAESQLNFPLARAQALGGLTQAQQALAEQALQFNVGTEEGQRRFDTAADQFAAQFGEQSRQFGLGLSEQGRQFNTGIQAQLGQFGATLQEQGRQFNAAELERQRQFTTTAQEGARQFDFGAQEQSRQFQELQSQAVRDFQSQLKQSAFINRLQLAGGQATAGLGLAGVSAPNIGPAFAGLSSSSTGSSPSGGILGQVAGGFGGGFGAGLAKGLF